MSTLEFIQSLRKLNIQLSVKNDRLRCNAPKGALTPALKAELSERKAEIMALLGGLSNPEASQIQPISREGNLPLSFSQQRLWFLDQLEQDQLDGKSATYNMSQALQLVGALDVDALEKAIAKIIQRHEILRTTFQTIDGNPVQVISPAESIQLPIVDLHTLTTSEQPETGKSETVQTLIDRFANDGFDLSREPSIRVKLLKLKADSQILLVAMHHIASDGWSMGIFNRELSTLYQDFAQNRPVSLPDLPIQYLDFAHWQRQQLQGARLQQHLNYWQQKLAEAPKLLDLPKDYPRPAVQTFQGDTIRFSFDSHFSKQLKTVAQESGTTLFITLLTAFSALLYRYSHSKDIVIGSPIANRTRHETEALIGFFANTLLWRIQLDEEISFTALLNQVKQTALEGYEHQDLPLGKLVEALKPERNLSYNPLFQVMFALQNSLGEALSLPGLRLTPLSQTRTTAKFDLSLSMTEHAEGLSGAWIYSTALFKPDTIQKMANEFKILLKEIVRSPHQSISAIIKASTHTLPLESKTPQTPEKTTLLPSLHDKIASLSPAKRALLEKKILAKKGLEGKNSEKQLQQRNNLIATRRPKISRPPNRPIPLSFAQQSLWLLDQITPGNPAYNRPTNIRFTGHLNIEYLEKSLNAIIRRHESLRTCFELDDTGQPRQNILPAFPLTLRHTDLTQLSDTAQAEKIHQIGVEEAQFEFNLSQPPLIHGKLIKLGEEDHLLLLTLHHIVFDGWSMGVLLKELGAFYGAFITHEPPSLPALPMQYADFTYWQKQQSQTETFKSQLNYWKQKLKGELSILELPIDRTRNATQTFRGEEYSFKLSQRLKRKLVAFAQQEEVTLFMLLLASFKTLLYRYTQMEDIIVGCPIAGRNLVESEALIGLFINTLVMRTTVEGNQSFKALLQQVRQVALDAYAHSEVPSQQLMEDLKLERNLSRANLFQVLFQYRNLPEETIDVQGLQIEGCTLETGVAILDLYLEVKEQIDGLSCTFKYDADLFEAATIQRMGSHFQRLLESSLAIPEQPIAKLPMLSEAEQQQILGEWVTDAPQIANTTPEVAGDCIHQGCIHQYFEAQARQSPDAIAVTFTSQSSTDQSPTGQSLTYKQINNRANQLAHQLIQMGVKPNTFVGICIERAPEMIVALLGVLKAGGAYVPIDPHYPSERIAFMLTDTQLSVLLTQAQWLETLPEATTPTLCLDRDWPTIASQPTANPTTQQVTSEHLAYIIYTSGSTGIPKGVMVQHSALVNFTKAAIADYGMSATDKVLQFASISFDAAAEEIYPCLTTGGTLTLRTDDMISSVEQFLQTCQDWQISVLDLPTAYWQQMVAELATGSITLPKALRLVIIGGERVSPESVRCWQAYVGDTVGDTPQLVNTYGPTEGTVVATAYWITADDDIQKEVPIGRAIANVQTYVLDPYQQPVPIGVPGELYIGGAGLAQGYLNQPALTAERFIDHPFSQNLFSQNTAKLYRTGDLVRYLPDGNLEFLGRIDQQVKIRGFRVELGAVETILLQHPQVQATAVMARPDTAGNQQLVAYVVRENVVKENIAEPDKALTVSDLRGFLKEALPEYMVPATFVYLEALPLTPNGKVDRRALPEPDSTQRSTDNEYVAPRNSTETALSQIWDELLKLDNIGIHDNFFELGGHSLLATQVVSRIRKTFSTELSLRTLFESPTIAGLSAQIAQKSSTDSPASISVIDRDRPLPLSFAQQRLWFISQLEGKSATYNIPKVFQLTGELNVAALEQALNEIIRRHESLRTTFETIEGKPVQVIAPASPFSLPVIDLAPAHLPSHSETEHSSHSSQQNPPQNPPQNPQQAQKLLYKLATAPFDISQDLLIRVTLLKQASQAHQPESYLLIVVMHHIISDGWSMGRFTQELSTLYRDFSQSRAPSLPDLPIQYVDFAHWQRQYLQDDVLNHQLSYWKAQLADAPAVLELSTDYPRPPEQTFQGGVVPFQLSAQLSEQCQTLAKQAGTTCFVTLLSAFAVLLHRYSQASDLVIGSPIANRNQQEIEPLIGFFVNTLLLRVKLADAPSFTALLKQVQQTALDAYAHQDLPFEKLVEALNPERNLSHHPLFQVMFVLQNATADNLDIPGIQLSPVRLERRIAKFDLTLSMRETPAGLIGAFEYNSDLFKSDTVQRLAEHFEKLLQATVAQPHTAISKLPILTAEQQQQILVEWNNTQTDYPRDKCIHQLFEEQVARSPHAVAVTFNHQQLTYQELNARANQLAHYLQQAGVAPRSFVGICLSPSIEMMIGLLAILKAGGTYVPIDPTYPKARISLILEDANIALLLSHSSLAPNLQNDATKVINIDTLDLGHSQNKENSNRKNLNINTSNSTVTATSLAYVCYTSGSTGKPKGVTVSHRAVNRLVRNTNYIDIQPTDRIAQASNVSFDAATFEIWGALLNGAELIGIPKEILLSGQQLKRQLHEQKISILFLTTALFNQLASTEPNIFSSLKYLLFGGEAVDVKWVRTVLKNGKPKHLLHVYGPTENTTFTSYYEVEAIPEEASSIPIGSPIANTQAYIFDNNRQPVPVGVPGELFIGGAGLAQGYLHRPALTKEKFILHSVSHQIQTRLYRTGDLARYRPDGQIEFVGRIDHQVKLRGFRIELSEIESVLSRHPHIKDVIVIAYEPQPGNK
ncbi:MAG: amino acid adenylation domain-containing protein [Phormidesmis sp.]